jgi:hypothetical protein
VVEDNLPYMEAEDELDTLVDEKGQPVPPDSGPLFTEDDAIGNVVVDDKDVPKRTPEGGGGGGSDWTFSSVVPLSLHPSILTRRLKSTRNNDDDEPTAAAAKNGGCGGGATVVSPDGDALFQDLVSPQLAITAVLPCLGREVNQLPTKKARTGW